MKTAAEAGDVWLQAMGCLEPPEAVGGKKVSLQAPCGEHYAAYTLSSDSCPLVPGEVLIWYSSPKKEAHQLDKLLV